MAFYGMLKLSSATICYVTQHCITQHYIMFMYCKLVIMVLFVAIVPKLKIGNSWGISKTSLITN